MTQAQQALARGKCGTLTILRLAPDTAGRGVVASCACGSAPYVVRAEALLRAVRPLRCCRECGYRRNPARHKKARAKVPAELRHSIALAGGAANGKRHGYGIGIVSLARQMVSDGVSQREVARTVGVSETTMHRWIQRQSYRETA